MKKLLVLCLSVMVILPQSANAFSLKNLFVKETKTQQQSKETVNYTNSVMTKIDNLNKQGEQLEKDVKNSFINLAYTLSPTDEAKVIEQNINKKESDVFQIIDDYTTKMKKNKGNTISEMEVLKQKDRETLSQNLNTLSNASKEYAKLSKESLKLGIDVVKNTSRGDTQTKLLKEVANAGSDFRDNAKSLVLVSNIGKTYSKLAKIKL